MDLNEFTLLILAHERLAALRNAAQREEYLRSAEPTPGRAWITLRDMLRRLTGGVRARSASASRSATPPRSSAAPHGATASPSTTRAA